MMFSQKEEKLDTLYKSFLTLIFFIWLYDQRRYNDYLANVRVGANICFIWY